MSRPEFEPAFRALFEERSPGLYRYLGALCGDESLARDVTQESFVKLYRRGTMPQRPVSWLLAVALNLLRDERRRGTRRQRLLRLRVAEVPAPDAPEPADARALANERVRAVRSALDRLPARDRQLLLLRHQGFSYREVAGAVDVAETSVGTLLIRAEAAFRTAFEELHGAPD